jgi:hypothetical protein
MSASPTSTGMSTGMSTVSRRIVAAVAAAIIAVLTGIAVGLVSPQVNCQPAAASEPADRPVATDGRPTGTPTTAAGLGDAAVDATAGAATGTTGGTTNGTTTALGRQAPGQVTCSVDNFEAVPAIVGVVGGLAAGAAAFVMLIGAERRRRTAPGRPAGGRARPVAPPSLPPDDHTTAELSPAGTRKNLTEADRAALIRACIYVRDRTTSRALADRLGAALRDAGVRTVEPAGARFDPAQHEAGGAAPSSDPAKIGTIAAVEVPGYADRDGRLLRVPVVTVYRTANEREDR